MKKILLSMGLCGYLFALSDNQVIEFYESTIKQRYPDAKINIKKRQKLENTEFETIVVDINLNNESQEDVIFVKDEFIFPDIINIKEKISYRQEHEVKKFQQMREDFKNNVKPELKKEKLVISLGDKNKPLRYVFTDPECPYCRAHLAKIEEELKTHQLKLILTPVHARSAFEKSALIYKESKNAKTDKEKIAILRKYFDENIKNYTNVSEQEYQEMISLYEKYRKLGLNGVPMSIDD